LNRCAFTSASTRSLTADHLDLGRALDECLERLAADPPEAIDVIRLALAFDQDGRPVVWPIAGICMNGPWKPKPAAGPSWTLAMVGRVRS